MFGESTGVFFGKYAPLMGLQFKLLSPICEYNENCFKIYIISLSWIPFACCAEAAAKKPVPYHIRIQNFFAKYPGALKPLKAGDNIPLSFITYIYNLWTKGHVYPKIQKPHWRWIPMMVTSVPVCWKHHLPEDLRWHHHMLLGRSWNTVFMNGFGCMDDLQPTTSVCITYYSPGRAPFFGFPNHCSVDYWSVWEPGRCWWCQTTASAPFGRIVLVVFD